MDYYLFVISSIIVFFVIHFSIRRRGIPYPTVYLFWPVLVAILLSGWFFTEDAGRNERTRVERLIGGMAPTYAQEIERLGHSRLYRKGVLDEKLYLEIVETQKRWLSVNRAVADIYTCRVNEKGEYYFLVDSETDYDRNGRYEGDREKRTPVGEIFQTAPPEIALAMHGESCFTKEIYSDRWGSWVSAFVPLHDNNGSVEAVLGVDYDAVK